MSTVILITPRKFGDNRGWFSETFNERRERDTGIHDQFVQDNQSYSRDLGTLRGIHFQAPPHAQAKLVRCLRGRILDIAVDLRKGSPTFGNYVSAELSEENGSQLYIPVGFGHAFVTLESNCEVAYKVSDYYAPEADGGIRYDCPDLAIDWPELGRDITLSVKDSALPFLKDFDSPFEYDGNPMSFVDGQ